MHVRPLRKRENKIRVELLFLLAIRSLLVKIIYIRQEGQCFNSNKQSNYHSQILLISSFVRQMTGAMYGVLHDTM